MSTAVLSLRVPEALIEHLETLAVRITLETGIPVDRGDIARKLLAAGVEANPVTEADRTAAKRAAKLAASGELPGLVIPLDAARGSRPPEPQPPKRGRRGPPARVLALTFTRIPGESLTESEGLSLAAEPLTASTRTGTDRGVR